MFLPNNTPNINSNFMTSFTKVPTPGHNMRGPAKPTKQGGVEEEKLFLPHFFLNDMRIQFASTTRLPRDWTPPRQSNKYSRETVFSTPLQRETVLSMRVS